ncbi:MAG: Phenylalanine--tRNA ligase beta subunit [Candidatus Thorarchaeota archaeon]|nr:MAG: Phenylalanine--tRNA ligase beta subunit [Candidatus Thorarchaeota archaeon]
MIVECRLDSLLELIGKDITLEKLEETLFLLKAEIEKVDGNDIEIEVNPDRQDMLSAEGIARAVRAFLGLSSGLPKMPVRKSGKEIIVGKGLEKIRPYIACSIIRGAKINEELVKEYMHLQESLTATHGRNRKKASIGLYVYKDIKFPIHYRLENPDDIEFIPLGYEEIMDGPTIIKEHEKGQIFGPIISKFRKWPLLIDSADAILSLPPIINSNNLGRITGDTSDIFVEVTGTHVPTVLQALNIMTASIAERGGKIQSVTIKYPDGGIWETPDLTPSIRAVNCTQVKDLLGLDLKPTHIIKALKRMCYGAKSEGKGKIEVSVPAFRTDILHNVDIIEDIAIGYGFDNIEPTMPETMTTGKLLPITRLKDKIRDLMIGVGYQEIISFIMSSPEIMNNRMNRDRELVETANPKSREYSILRNSLLPVLLDFTSQNQHADYPQQIFEVGDIVVPDQKAETRCRQIPALCGLTSDTTVNVTDMINEVGFILRNLGLEEEFEFRRKEDSSFITGRCAEIIVKNKTRGILGEISPEVLKAFKIGMPVVSFELDLPRDCQW